MFKAAASGPPLSLLEPALERANAAEQHLAVELVTSEVAAAAGWVAGLGIVQDAPVVESDQLAGMQPETRDEVGLASQQREFAMGPVELCHIVLWGIDNFQCV